MGIVLLSLLLNLNRYLQIKYSRLMSKNKDIRTTNKLRSTSTNKYNTMMSLGFPDFRFQGLFRIQANIYDGVFFLRKPLTIISEKLLCQSLFFNKVAGLRPATLLKKRLWHIVVSQNLKCASKW